MTADPHTAAKLRFVDQGDGYHAIKWGDQYMFAGDQATVKWGKKKVKNWERFKIRTSTVMGIKVCTIKCKRDGCYWYMDTQMVIRHRNPKEQGFKCHVWAMSSC